MTLIWQERKYCYMKISTTNFFANELPYGNAHFVVLLYLQDWTQAICFVPLIIAHCPPASSYADLHTTLTAVATDQANLSMLTHGIVDWRERKEKNSAQNKVLILKLQVYYVLSTQSIAAVFSTAYILKKCTLDKSSAQHISQQGYKVALQFNTVSRYIPMHRTPASSWCRQLWFPTPEWPQSASLLSVPVQLRSSRWMAVSPLPKKAFENGTESWRWTV